MQCKKSTEKVQFFLPRIQSQPLRIGNSSHRRDPDKAIGYRHFMQIRIFAVENESIWSPDFVEKCPVHGEFIQLGVGAIEHQSLVGPKLSEITVQTEGLTQFIHGSHGPHGDIDFYF